MNQEQRKAWNENHKRLTDMIAKPAEHQEAVELFLSQHAWLYAGGMDGDGHPTMEDELVQDIKEETLRRYPVEMPDTRNSIVWHLWHIARIEDMTMNVLIHGGDQLFHNWQAKMNVTAVHSGNEMREEEAAAFSATVDPDALFSYRLAVGRRTREIMRSLQPGQFKTKVDPARIRRLLEQGAVKDEARWLLDYWGGKTFAGLVLMPATRHPFVHLNRCLRIKEKYQK
ncbi:hypothetical protein DLM86_16495 [Paenibacillus flagellatus]|uniref:DinB-like domain-containing protein n=2 Tax=Paenibacillus flagellatus TaxID=2211139 RepID=A0A2V5KH15_9BACL|nr:hypothetical protein DLM86_16495 [Paenibacillus flagellatus]